MIKVKYNSYCWTDQMIKCYFYHGTEIVNIDYIQAAIGNVNVAAEQ